MKVVALNFIRFGILHGLGEVVMFFATVFITVLTTIFCFFAMKYYQATLGGALVSVGVPLLICLLLSYFVAQLFSHIWEVSSDAILHAYCVDHEVHKNRGIAA